MSADNRLVLSHLYKASKSINQLRILEEGTLIKRIGRDTERRISYIDVGNLHKMKEEQDIRETRVKHMNR